MTVDIRNPAKLPTELYPAEEKFARCLAGGEPCKIEDGELPKKGIESGEGANVVRSEVIRFFTYGGNEDNPVLGSMLSLRGAWISGDLDLMHASTSYALMFGNCHFADLVVMLHMECAALYLNGSHLAQGLHADGLTTKGDVNLRDGFSAESEVRLLGANIGRNLDCKGGKFNNSDGDALSADGLTTAGNVNLRDGFSAEGEVRLLDAHIGRNLDCKGGKFNNPDGKALYADGLTAKGGVSLSGGFSAEGEVRLLSANVGGSFDCTDGKFHNSGRKALSADGLMTTGSVNLRDGFSAEGEVRLLSACIGGNLSCVGGKFRNAGGNALIADRLTTTGGVYLRDDFSAEGMVRLLGANISGNLDCVNGKFHNPKKYALNVSAGNIGSGLLWRKTTCKGIVNLAGTKADALVDDSDSWKSCKVILDGFVYNRFVDPVDAQSRIESRIDWLAKRPDGMSFSPLPYEQAAKVLRAMGRGIDAWDIERERNCQKREADRESRIQRLGGWILDTLKDAGYHPLRIVKWGFCVMAFGVAVFACADYHGNIVPTHPVVALSEDYRRKIAPNCCNLRPTQAVKPEYPAFNSFVFSLDVFTPTAVFHQEDSWRPRSGNTANWGVLTGLAVAIANFALLLWFLWLIVVSFVPASLLIAKHRILWRLWGGGVITMIAIFTFIGAKPFDILWLLTFWYWLEISIGWVLIPLFLLSAPGLLRPRQSSSEKD